jgi:hypothetical protein
MKRKPNAKTDPVALAEDSLPDGSSPEIVSPEILAEARRSLDSDRIKDGDRLDDPERLKPALKCVVCGSKATAHSAEQLCWVCRRLKISAWRDVEAQAPVQE